MHHGQQRSRAPRGGGRRPPPDGVPPRHARSLQPRSKVLFFMFDAIRSKIQTFAAFSSSARPCLSRPQQREGGLGCHRTSLGLRAHGTYQSGRCALPPSQKVRFFRMSQDDSGWLRMDSGWLRTWQDDSRKLPGTWKRVVWSALSSVRPDLLLDRPEPS